MVPDLPVMLLPLTVNSELSPTTDAPREVSGGVDRQIEGERLR